MKIDWKRKLTSRKLWMALAGFITSLILAIWHDAETAETVAGIIMSGGCCIAYILGEGWTDAEALARPQLPEREEKSDEGERH